MLVKWWKSGIAVSVFYSSGDPIMHGLSSTLYRRGKWGIKELIQDCQSLLQNGWDTSPGCLAHALMLLGNDLGSQWKVCTCHSISLLSSWAVGDLLGAEIWSIWMTLFHGQCESCHMRDMDTVETNPQEKEGTGSPCHDPKIPWPSLFWLGYSTLPGVLWAYPLNPFFFLKVNLDWFIWPWWGVVEY